MSTRDAAFWDKIAPKYATDPISDQAAYSATLTRMRDLLPRQATVLELGCGTGSTALELAGGVSSYLGTDVSPGMIDIARAKLGADTAPGLSFAVADAGTLPAGPFDTVIALNLLHLVRDLDAVVAQIFEALPRGGLFLSKTGLISDGAWFLPLAIPVMRAIGKAPFVRNLSRAELEAAITRADFEVKETLLQPDTAPRLFVVARKP
ncbi:class I SAM-dependent methyltransferase [Gymnodinialimonas ulvae]|uniref:class I SAM-dependent methyltransferase n=1 Tax=Gymnodinialimonas ulvae TaxID=3126504 RepID=UPI0030AADF2D